MSTLGFWSVNIILYQTIISVIVSWLILSCRLLPHSGELHEITLMKLLYLYDPVACGRSYLYNYTGEVFGHTVATVIWPLKNHVAADFRSKVKISLSLHIIWSFLGIVNLVMKDRPCGYYTVLLPFTLTGLTMIIVDIVHGILFLIDAGYTSNENAILDYLNHEKECVIPIQNRNFIRQNITTTDTTWIAIIFAYISFRGVVQLIINFWVVKDNYFEGSQYYRRLQFAKHTKRKLTSKSSQYLNL